jgi:NADPH:quinone reductase-like Zn-dependent oxidoreductase
MWAYQLVNGSQTIKKVELPIPIPKDNEVLIKFKAAAMNARDYAIYAGHYPISYPKIALSDGAGTIEQLGCNVIGFEIGDDVLSCFYDKWESGVANDDNHQTSLGCESNGVLSEYYCLPVSAIVVKPAHLSFVEAATLPCAALTAWSALFIEGNLKAGEHVLIQGTGGVSIFALQFAKLIGAEITLISSCDEKLNKGREMGAHHAINYSSYPNWGQKVFEQNGGKGVDLVVEVGGGGTLNQSLKAIKVGGKISIIGALTGVTANISILDILFRHVHLNGVTVGNRQAFIAMNKAITLSGLVPIVDRCYGLNEVDIAYEKSGQGGHFGKIVITSN